VARRIQLEVLPRRDELDLLVGYYRHLQNEHKRAAPESGTRRRIEERMLDARERFERLLTEWVPEDDLRRAWREHLRNRAPEPPGPPAIRPLVFRGRSDAASVVEIRGKKGEELEVAVDGTVIERIAAEKDFAFPRRHASFRLGSSEFVETFGASKPALDALVEFLESDSSPPWEYGPELLEDGLIDARFALTPRGRRALAR
jgi:hypothetical protein